MNDLWYPGQEAVWKSGTFTVPDDVSEERVMFRKREFMGRFGDYLEKEGFTVLSMTEPRQWTEPGIDEDRRMYLMWARVRRRPVQFTVDVPDNAVRTMEKVGLKLKD